MRLASLAPSRLFLPLLLVAVFSTPSAAIAGGLVGKGEIRESGREAAEQIEKEEGLYQNAAAQRRVRLIGNMLARGAKYQEGTVFAFQVLDMEEVNAFALPSGHVYVTRGLLDRVGKNDGMLAAVLAHEIGHLSELHSHKRVEKVLTQGLAFTFLDAIFGEDLGKHGRLLAGLVDAFMSAEYSQDQEIESDKYGIVLAAQAGYDPGAMISFLRLLATEEKRDPLSKYFGSHPHSATRVKLAEEFLAQYEQGTVDVAKYTSPPPPDSAFTYDYPRLSPRSRVSPTTSGE